MTTCDLCVVRNRAICAGLNADELAVLNQMGRRRTLEPGEALIWEGDESVLVANVVEGVLQLSSSTADGREQVVGVVYPSDFIGRPFAGSAGQTVTALTKARLCVFARPDFDRFASEHPRLEHKLLERTLSELDRTRKWMVLLSRKSAQEKVATFLLEMSDKLGESGCEVSLKGPLRRFELPFSRQQVADVLGLTIETVSRQMTLLKRDGIIALPTRRMVEILDRAALEDLTD